MTAEELLKQEFMAGVQLGQQQGVALAQKTLGAVLTANGNQPLPAEIIVAVLHQLAQKVTTKGSSVTLDGTAQSHQSAPPEASP